MPDKPMTRPIKMFFIYHCNQREYAEANTQI